MKNKNKKDGGFIQAVLIIIGALVILKYAYKVDVIGFLTTGNFKAWLDRFYNLALEGWKKYDWLAIKVWDYSINFLKGIFANK